MSVSSSSSRIQPVLFNNTVRDFVQSNLGTYTTGQEIVDAQAHAHQVGWHSIQITGGTFLDLFQLKGRDGWRENEVLCGAFPGMKKTMLVRGDFGLGYDRVNREIIEDMILEFAKMGVNVVTNFHGKDDTRMMRSVADATKRAREEFGFDIYAQGGLTISDNPNVTLEMCEAVTARNTHNGHQDIYIKCANGKLSPEATYNLVTRLKEISDQKIFIHTHNTYGLAYAVYLAAIEAGVDCIDVLPPYFAEGTAQPDAVRMMELMRAHPSQSVRERVPELNIEAMAADAEAGLALRHKYKQHELRFNRELIAAMYKAGAAGGAAATLRNPSLEGTLKGRYGVDWDQQQIMIYTRQSEIAPLMGSPEQVTPYAKNATDQAAQSLALWPDQPPLSRLTEGTAKYLAGVFGYVPEDVSPELRAQARAQLGLPDDYEFIRADALPNDRAFYANKLEAAGVANPTKREIVSAATMETPEKGVQYVANLRAGTLKPPPEPELPDYLKPQEKPDYVTALNDYDVAMALGGAPALEALALQVLEIDKYPHYRAEIAEPKLQFKAATAEPAEGRAGRAFYDWQYRLWRDDAAARVKEYIESVAERFREAGFHKGHTFDAVERADRILAEVCRFKGASTQHLPKISIGLVYEALPKGVSRRELEHPSSEA